jgi:O-antigen/teichoic acid export membrane protein
MSPRMDQPSPKPRLLRDSTLYFVGNVANRFFGFIMMPFYTNHLTPAQYGILNLVELSITVVAIVFGLQTVGQTMTRLYHDETDADARRTVISTALVGAALASLMVAVLAIAFAPGIAVVVNLPNNVGLLRADFAAMAFGSIAEMVLVYYRLVNRARFFVVYSLAAMVASLLLNIWFIGVLHFGVWGFVSSKLIVGGCSTAVLSVLALREVGVRVDLRYVRIMARFGWPLVISSVAFYSIHFSDRLFLAHVSQADVGIYSLAYNFAFLLSVLVGDSFGKSWGVSFYGYASGEGWQKRFATVAFWLVLVLGAATVGISLFGRDTLRLLVPADYLPPLLMLPVLVFGYFFREIGDFFCSILLIGQGSGQVGRIALAGAAVNVVLNWLLIAGPAHWGIWGAAVATAATWLLYCGVCWLAAWRLHRVPFSASALAKILALSAACLALSLIVRVANPYLAMLADGLWFGVFLAGAALIYLGQAERRDALAVAAQGWQAARPYFVRAAR